MEEDGPVGPDGPDGSTGRNGARAEPGAASRLEPAEPDRPQPTLAQLDALTEQMSQAGLEVTTTIDGDPAGLPASIDLSAYRIVQEALTNTLKHAGPGTAAAVSVMRRSGSLEVHVTDRGGHEPTAAGADAPVAVAL